MTVSMARYAKHECVAVTRLQVLHTAIGMHCSQQPQRTEPNHIEEGE